MTIKVNFKKRTPSVRFEQLKQGMAFRTEQDGLFMKLIDRNGYNAVAIEAAKVTNAVECGRTTSFSPDSRVIPVRLTIEAEDA